MLRICSASCIGVAADEVGLDFGNGTHHQLHEGEVHVDCGDGTTRNVAKNHNNKSRDDGGDDPPSYGMMHSMPLSDGSTHHRLGLAGVLGRISPSITHATPFNNNDSSSREAEEQAQRSSTIPHHRRHGAPRVVDGV